MRVFVPELEQFVVEVLTKVGIGEGEARTTAEVLVTTDTWGTFTHGVKNLRGYVRRIKGGGIRTNAKPKVVAEGPAWALVDGDSALGMITSTLAMRTAMAKAKASGIGYAGVRNSCHFGAAGYYASLAAKAGMIGVAMCNDVPSVTAPGARGPVLGSNPFAFAVPSGKEKPIILDIATSTVAGGKVFAAAALGKKIPDHWVVDGEGLPTTDPTGYPQTGTLTPMAGHKGYGLALFIETLSGVLTGAAMTQHVLSWSFDDPSLPTDHGAAFIAMDVNAMMPGDTFKQRVDQMIRELHELPKAKGSERIFLPGEMEWERREKALVDGIDLPEDVAMSLRALGEELGLDVGQISR